jgi:hypothetical protein
MMRTTGNDRGAVRVVTVARLAVILAIIGVLGYDGFSCMSTRVATETDAQNAAYAASQAWHTGSPAQNLDVAYQAAVTSLTGKKETVLTQGFTVDPDGTIHLTIVSNAHTIVLGRIGPTKKLTVATEHGDANSVN